MSIQIQGLSSRRRLCPVILLVDNSSHEGRLGQKTLNETLRRLVVRMQRSTRPDTPLQLAIITFGASARLHTPLTSVDGVELGPLSTCGAARFGDALQLARHLIEDRELIPSRSTRPVVVLVSEGSAFTDGWEADLRDFTASGRTSKVVRVALPIGSTPDCTRLRAFAGDDSLVVPPGDVDRILGCIRTSPAICACQRGRAPTKLVDSVPSTDF